MTDGLARLDRAAERRDDAAWLAVRWSDVRTRVLHVADGQVAAVGDPPRPLLEAPYPTGAERVLLGVDPDRVAYFAVLGRRPDAGEVDGGPSAGPGGAPVGLRELLASADPFEAELLVQAVGLANWHEAHPRCPRCGGVTVIASGGYVRRCGADGSEHHPRTDPAVIVLVTDEADRALLGRHVRWPAPLFSTLAGFVEPGESAEDAVVREVREESAVVVTSVEYFGSQAWPFPASLMLGFRGRGTWGDPVADGTELAEVRWFTREELAAGLAGGELLLPPRSSVARRLVEDWYGGPVG